VSQNNIPVDESTAPEVLAFRLRDTLGRGARRVRIEAGPPLGQLTVLGHLQRRGALSTNDLAVAERVRPQSMSVTIKSLEKDGFVKKRPHPTDGRQMLVEMTPKGIKTLQDIFAIREDWLAHEIRKNLSERQREELGRGLDIIQAIIDN
jgi:DNA-binding MarR family transcriptional regulator